MHNIGDGNIKTNYYDYITVDLVYETMDDSVFFEARRKVQITEPEFEGSIDECFAMLYPGDSASFILKATDFFIRTLGAPVPSFLSFEDSIKITVNVLEVKTPEQFQKEKEQFLSWIEDFSEYEQVLLRQYIDEEQISVYPTNSGLYHIIINEGNGIKIHRGDTLVINFEGRFLNGDLFDSTWKRKSSFEFILGQEWQVLPGIEEAVGRMTELEESFFILPSSIAFGQQGSSTGIIPPFTSVLFKIKIEKVSPRKIALDSLQ